MTRPALLAKQSTKGGKAKLQCKAQKVLLNQKNYYNHKRTPQK